MPENIKNNNDDNNDNNEDNNDGKDNKDNNTHNHQQTATILMNDTSLNLVPTNVNETGANNNSDIKTVTNSNLNNTLTAAHGGGLIGSASSASSSSIVSTSDLIKITGINHNQLNQSSNDIIGNLTQNNKANNIQHIPQISLQENSDLKSVSENQHSMQKINLENNNDSNDKNNNENDGKNDKNNNESNDSNNNNNNKQQPLKKRLYL